MLTYEFHPAAEYFPLHTPEEFAELLGSLRQHGYDTSHPIVLCDGMILDGRNRYRACQELGLEATFVIYTGNPYAKAWLENGSRRNLSQGQKAAIYLKINMASENWLTEQQRRQIEANRKRSEATQARKRTESGTFQSTSREQHYSRLGSVLSNDTSQQEERRGSALILTPEPVNHIKATVAKETGVSKMTAQAAISVAKKAPHLLDEVASGKLSLQDATREANRHIIKAKAGDNWTPFERERRRWVEELGYPTLANYHKDPHLIEWAKANGRHVFIGRGGQWGNPFELGKDGTREYVIESYCDYYFPRKPSLRKALSELDGKVLECYCLPEHCHGEVFIETLRREAWELLDEWLRKEGHRHAS